MNIPDYIIYTLISCLTFAVIFLSISLFKVTEERDYYKRTTYDPQRFSVLAPSVRSLMNDMLEVTGGRIAYVALFHNGVNWSNDKVHPPYVNKVFQLNNVLEETPKIKSLQEYQVNAEIVGNAQNIPLDPIDKIYETLQGKCVGINISDSELNIELRCPIFNQRSEVVGYYSVIMDELKFDQINKFLTLVNIYQSRLNEILFAR